MSEGAKRLIVVFRDMGGDENSANGAAVGMVNLGRMDVVAWLEQTIDRGYCVAQRTYQSPRLVPGAVYIPWHSVLNVYLD